MCMTGAEWSRNFLKRTVKIVNVFLFSRMRSKLGMLFKSGMFPVQIFSVSSEPKLKDRMIVNDIYIIFTLYR